jgi:hypothetical protein
MLIVLKVMRNIKNAKTKKEALCKIISKLHTDQYAQLLVKFDSQYDEKKTDQEESIVKD